MHINAVRVISAGTFALAWLMTEFAEPIRLGATMVMVPPIARYWKKVAEEEEVVAKSSDDQSDEVKK